MKETRFVFCLCLAFTAALAAPGIAIGQTEAPEPEGESYVIGPGDVLRISTWKEADFTREVFVRTDGKISFPLLNELQAAGKEPMELKRDLESGLKDFIENPIVTVSVAEPVSQKFYILGEIEETGEYQLNKNLTVLQAIALAHGFSEWASKKEIILLRTENGEEKIIRINYKKIIKGKDFSQNIRIKADDTIIVP
ncbi:MAG: polysaccharide export protein [Desulfobacterales bacterium]|nr:polysaccharide export protein [Desulfobacterales bacterium]